MKIRKEMNLMYNEIDSQIYLIFQENLLDFQFYLVLQDMDFQSLILIVLKRILKGKNEGKANQDKYFQE